MEVLWMVIMDVVDVAASTKKANDRETGLKLHQAIICQCGLPGVILGQDELPGDILGQCGLLGAILGQSDTMWAPWGHSGLPEPFWTNLTPFWTPWSHVGPIWAP